MGREITLYDTRTRRPQRLEPRDPGRVGIYACGPTVYSRVHVGNARPYVTFLLLKRFLEHEGYEVSLVVNVTDVNDKIYAAAATADVASDALAREMTAAYVADTDRLGLGRPDHEPLASETIGPIVALISDLVEGEHAYEAGGDVYYRVGRFVDYGRLSNQRADALLEQEPNARKEDPRDFALWKGNKPGEDTWWESPWGRGRPGWHIECSAMSEKHLGTTFEIHGGGLDLVFPHHENEIAQSRALGHEFARIWMHNGMLAFRGEEMHKSAGNDVSLKEALDRWGRETMLVFYMSGHWRKPLDYSDATLEAARAQWLGFQGAFRVPRAEPPPDEWQRLVAALEEDFNLAAALAILHDWRSRGFWSLLDRGLRIFGLELPAMAGSEVEVERLREERDDARRRKDWAEADRLREEIRRRGFDVVDEAAGSRLVSL